MASGAAIFVGFDSAWADKKTAPGAICSVLYDGSVFSDFRPPEPMRFDGALKYIHGRQRDDMPTLVALDQPTIVPNATSMRPVEKVAASLISWMGGGVQPANSGLRLFRPDAPIWRFLKALKATENPETARTAESGLHLMEVFPALALASLHKDFFAQGKGPRYNPARPTFKIEHWSAVVAAARHEADRLGCAPLGAWLADLLAMPAPKKADQDRLDAALCLLIAIRWRLCGRDESVMIGDLKDGYIVAPVSEGVMKRLRTEAVKRGVRVDDLRAASRVNSDDFKSPSQEAATDDYGRKNHVANATEVGNLSPSREPEFVELRSVREHLEGLDRIFAAKSEVKENQIATHLGTILDGVGGNKLGGYSGIFWALVRIFRSYDIICNSYDAHKDNADKFDLDVEADVEHFLIRLRVVMDEISFVIRMSMPKVVRYLSQPGGEGNPDYYQFSINQFLRFTSKHKDIFPILTKLFDKNRESIGKYIGLRDYIAHFRARAIVFSGPALSVGLIGARDDPRNFTRPRVDLQDYVDEIMLWLWAFIEFDVVEYFRERIESGDLEVSRFGFAASFVNAPGIGRLKRAMKRAKSGGSIDVNRRVRLPPL